MEEIIVVDEMERKESEKPLPYMGWLCGLKDVPTPYGFLCGILCASGILC
ncbi:hypothetical protein C823_003381 [Eubacterium plexicaudatum ASF492]|uniref:Uncharacterized protein n=1 Tax=Eubacterium plexicaudatum ASF492 TaxID=1235802 RepID=N2AU24_9FIRM|nr:hypothetical protein C823_003381 [Eubacterium plexicaudatum ASF492]